MREILRERSQNGRWGVSVVTRDVPEEYLELGYGRGTPELIREKGVPGTLTHLGRDGSGSQVYRLDYDPASQTWVVAGEDLEVVSGATQVVKTTLQGHRHATLLLAGADAVVKSYGYRRRSSSVSLYRRGVKEHVPEAVLLAYGITPSTGQIRPTPEVPDLDPRIREALAEATR